MIRFSLDREDVVNLSRWMEDHEKKQFWTKGLEDVSAAALMQRPRSHADSSCDGARGSADGLAATSTTEQGAGLDYGNVRCGRLGITDRAHGNQQ